MSNTNKIMQKFLTEFKAEDVLPSFQVEYAPISKWGQLWLTITRQPRPTKPLNIEMKSDTVQFKRPKPYLDPQQPVQPD